MENASKALIIAGAILISILIIGLGVYIYQQAQGTVKRANLRSQEAIAQNTQFEDYFGDKRTAQEVKQLCSTVRSNNITSETDDELKKIYLVYGGAITEPNVVSKSVKFGKTYYVGVPSDKAKDEEITTYSAGTTIEGYYKSGYIKVIEITENGSTGGSGSDTHAVQ